MTETTVTADTSATTGAAAAPTSDPAQAQQLLKDMANDRAAREKLLNGDVETRTRFDQLSEVAARSYDNRIEAALAGYEITDGPETLKAGELSRSELTSAVDHLSGMGLRQEVVAEAFNRQSITPEVRREAERMRRELLSNPDRRAALLNGDAKETRDLALLSIVLSSPVKGENE